MPTASTSATGNKPVLSDSKLSENLRDCLPKGWLDTIDPIDQEWIGKSLFTQEKNSSARLFCGGIHLSQGIGVSPSRIIISVDAFSSGHLTKCGKCSSSVQGAPRNQQEKGYITECGLC